MSLLAQTSTQQLVTSSITAVNAQFQTLSTLTFNVSSINGIVPGAAFSGSTVALSTGLITTSTLLTNALTTSSITSYGTVDIQGNVLSNVGTEYFIKPLYTTTFLPTNISGLKAWFDASKPASITSNGSGQVFTWSNLAGFANATQSVASNTPVTGQLSINSLNTVQFNPTNEITFGPISYTTATRAVFAVLVTPFNPSVTNKGTYIFGGQDATLGTAGFHGYQFAASGFEFQTSIGGGSGVGYVTYTALSNAGAFSATNAWLLSYHPGNGIFVNGTSNSTAGNLNTGSSTDLFGSIGQGFNVNTFYVAEFLQYDTTFSLAQRQTVEGYLAWKWGIQSRLNGTHPYLSIAPPPLGITFLAMGGITADTGSNISFSATNKIRLTAPVEIPTTLNTSSITVSTINGSTFTQLITQPLQSTFNGLGTAGYISTAQLTSTVRGIGSGFTGSTLGLSAGTIGVSTINSVYLSSVQGYISSFRTDSLTVGGPTGYVTIQDLTTATISTGQLVAGAGFISSLQINTLSFGPSGYVIVGDVIANSLSTTRLNTQALYTNNLYVGNVSSQSAILFPGVDGNYRGTAVAERTTGTGTSELLLYKVSSTTDQIRLHTTGNMVFEVGAPSRSWNSTTQLATPSLYIAGSTSNVGIGTASPATTFDVVGTGRFQILSSLSLNVSTINGAAPWQQFYLTSTVQGLGVAGYISSAQLTSTTQGLTRGLGSAGYISSSQLTSTVQGLAIVAANAFTGSTTSLSAGTIFVSSVKMNTMLISTMSMVDTTLVSTSGSITQDNLVLYFNTMPFAGTQAWFGQMIIPPGPPLTSIFSYTGASQTFVVPTSVNSINAYMWGAGGGGVATASGGAGAFIQAAVPVTPGETLTLIVGGGGGVASTVASFGGGGAGGGGGFGTQGGGRTAIQRGSIGATDYIVVGAGGGGTSYSSAGAGGAGGISAGSPAAGTTGLEGQGGTQSAGGAGTSGVISAGASGTLGAGGAAGAYGGGGGSGYYGGGGSGATAGVGGSGGGGSSFVNNVVPIALTAGSGGTAPNTADQFYVAPVAAGGTSISGTGGNGLIVVSYTAAPPAAPSGLTLTLNGTTATLSWTSAGVPLYYWAFYGNSISAYTGTYLMSGSTAGTSVSYSLTATLFDYFRLVSLSPLGCISAIVSSPIVQVPAPTGLSLSASGTTITMSWSAVSGATSYTYTLFSNSSYAYSGSSVATATVGGTTATYSSGVSGTYYYFSVNATTSYGTSLSTTSGIVQDSTLTTSGTLTTFNYVGSNQSYTVPSGVTSLTVYMWGAGGAQAQPGAAGAGAFISGNLAVSSGSPITLLVGGAGSGTTGGFGGGGNGGYGGGGGRSAIIISGTEVVTVGAGGGSGWLAAGCGGFSNGFDAFNGSGTGGRGGTTTAGGVVPTIDGGAGATAGSLRQGGQSTRGGGGGGYYGGSAGGASSFADGGGGGGSSYTTNPAFTFITGSNSPNLQNQAPATGVIGYVSNAGAAGSNGLILVSVPLSATITPAAGNTATLSWTPSAEATGYSWIVYQSATNGYVGTSFATGSTNSTTYTATVTGLNLTSYYYFTVIATGTTNSAAAVSAIMYELPDEPAAPTCTTSGTTVNMSWSAVAGARYYTYTVYQGSAYAYTGIQVATANNGNSLSATYAGVATNYYYFTVSVTTSAGTSALATSGIAQAAAFPIASGGTLTTPTGYQVYTFSNVGSNTFTVTSPSSVSAQIMAIAGGGGAGGWAAGGGGAGAVIFNTYTLTNTSYSVVVGAGGAGAPQSINAVGSNGSNTTFGAIITAPGGGGGGSYTGSSGAAGGCGGGGGGTGTTSSGGAGNPGYAGGSTTTANSGGSGGGGMGGVGGNGTASGGGNGGIGITCVIGGSTYLVGGGGGGGPYGGSGGTASFGGGAGSSGIPSPGTPNTGGGGGGPNTGGGASGGSGVVVIALTLPPSSPANPTLVSSGSSATMSWTASAGATGYSWILYQSATNAYAGSSFATGTTTSATTATATGLSLNSYYYFTVSATGAAGTSPAVASAIVLQLITGPATATLTVSATTLSLSWGAVAGATSYTYTIYSGAAYSYTGMAFVTSVSTVSTSASYAGTAGTYYYFGVTATTSSGTSGPTASGVVQASVAAITPTIGNATLTTDYTTTTASGITYYYFIATGKTMTFTPSAPVSATYLTIGGGGGGGNAYGGGGGAGGLQQGTASLTSSAYSIVIGTGGAGAPSTGENGPYSAGTNGISTTFSGSGVSITALGGGQGGPGYSPSFTPSSGGCGGGGGGVGPGIAGTGTQGFNGAAGGSGGSSGGGGGGVGGAGVARNGGIGITYNGSNYGGGGGGNGTASFGGGNGGLNAGDATGKNGTANTGGGGGGSTWNNSVFAAAGAGGSGICILSYGVPPSAPTSPTLSITTGTATLGWTAAAGAAGYSWILYRSSTNAYNGLSNASGTTTSAVTATASGLSAGFFWYFTVAATAGSTPSAAIGSSIVAY